MTSPRLHGECDPRFVRVQERFAAGFASGDDLGAAVAVTVDGRPVVDLWGGYRDLERALPWERDTIVNVHSTTKGMTALCAHQLIEQGRLELDTSVARLWPEFAAGGKEDLPVRYLLTHQAGLPAVRQPLPAEALFDWDQMTAALAAQPPWWEPGTKHGYHAISFGFLVGEVVRRTCGQTLGSYFREHIARPLGLDFHIGFGPELDARVSDIHPLPRDATPDALPEGPLGDFIRQMQDPTTMTGAAFSNPPIGEATPNTRAWRAAEIPAVNGHGSARALARVYGALAVGGHLDGVHVLSRESIERALAEQVFGPDAVLGGLPMRFGLGFMLRQDLIPIGPNPRAFGHAGAGGSIAFCDPDARMSFAYVPNRMQASMVGGFGAFQMIDAVFEAL